MFLLEAPRVFSQSALWALQRRYFADMGVEAWCRGEVPQYVTSNLTLANSYAELALAFLRDQDHLAPAEEPIYLCELGAGSGRFSFHFLKRLEWLSQQSQVSLKAFRYILTDFTQANLDFWTSHPWFQRFFESGMLDVALFDLADSDHLVLQRSRKTIKARTLRRPLVVIANYVFDSIPQDLFYLGEGECRQCLVSLLVDKDPTDLGAAELLETIHCQFEHQPVTGVVYEEPWLEQLLTGYRRALRNTHLLFPAPGLRSLQRLGALSRRGLLLLSADKGAHRLTALEGQPLPGLVRHGSFSLGVNYHAIKAYCESSGGLALFPGMPPNILTVGACLMVAKADRHVETQRIYQRCVQAFSPDDFFTITKHARRTIPEMSVPEILAYLRLSRFDSHQFGRYLPRLMELAPQFERDAHRAVNEAIDQVWDSYFPLGEEYDLAHAIALLLYEMDDYPRALEYFARSMQLYGTDCGTLANMATCHRLLGHAEEAEALLRLVSTAKGDETRGKQLDPRSPVP